MYDDNELADAWAEGYKARMRDDAETELDPERKFSWLEGLSRNPYKGEA